VVSEDGRRLYTVGASVTIKAFTDEDHVNMLFEWLEAVLTSSKWLAGMEDIKVRPHFIMAGPRIKGTGRGTEPANLGRTDRYSGGVFLGDSQGLRIVAEENGPGASGVDGGVPLPEV
jgi:hypothetical protein